MLAISDIHQVVEGVWETVLNLRAEPEVAANGGIPAREFLRCRVDFSGAWHGAITLDCPTALARQAAGIMFDLDAAACTDEDTRDALAELGNVVGGNLKTLLPAPCSLSLPNVAAADSSTPPAAATQIRARSSYRCQGQAFAVTVFEHS
ncbi:MAG: chemotaxis protein CheX [Planctomycetes bacterium]|nr:chemotaxis protein CheX [Planctomycetota bacterium]